MADYSKIKTYLLEQLGNTAIESQQHLRDLFTELTLDYRIERGLPYIFESRADQEKMFAGIVMELMNEEAQDFSFGPLEPILMDPEVGEIMINGTKGIFVEKNGELVRSEHQFESNEEIMRVIQLIAHPTGRKVDESHPVVDLRLADGSRVNIVIPPIALDGPLVTIRKFLPHNLGWDELIQEGSISEDAVKFLKACVQGRINIMVSGAVGSGKSSLLNNLLGFTLEGERVIAVESAAELNLESDQFLRLESRPPNIEGRGEVSLSALTQNAMKMRPERIILGEVTGAESLDIMLAMNTGIDGSMFAFQANTPRDALARLETIMSQSDPGIPVRAIREQMVSAIDLIVHIARLRDGSRKVLFITEVTGMSNSVITMQNIFEYQQTDFKDGKIIGELKATGAVPQLLDALGNTKSLVEGLFPQQETVD